MRTSPTIVEKVERWLTAPGWAYLPIRHFPLMPPRQLPLPPRRPGAAR